MREKNFNERVEELKEKYEGINDFDFETIIQLEDEYNDLIVNTPEHTKRRNEILMMRRDLSGRLKVKPEKRKDMYVGISRNINNGNIRTTIYCDGNMYCINNGSFEDIVDVIINHYGLKNNNIYLDTNGLSQGIADELNSRGISFNKMPYNKFNYVDFNKIK